MCVDCSLAWCISISRTVALQFPLLAGDDEGENEDWRDVLYICASVFWLVVVLWAQVVCQLGNSAASSSSNSFAFVFCGGKASSEGSNRLVLYAHRMLIIAPVALLVVGIVRLEIPAPVTRSGERRSVV